MQGQRRRPIVMLLSLLHPIETALDDTGLKEWKLGDALVGTF